MAETPPRKSGVVAPRRLTFFRQVLASFAAFLLWLLIRTWRRVWKDRPDNEGATAPVIFCIWHNHLALALASDDEHVARKWNHKHLAAMVSASDDGAFLSAVLARFGVATVRGSTSRRGPQALLEASRWLRKGYSVAITPDGPRGPAHQVQDGVIYLAQVSGRPIIPISSFANWKIRLNSWDRFQIPMPFARCELYAGSPIFVPREAGDAERAQLRLKLQEAMRAITRD